MLSLADARALALQAQAFARLDVSPGPVFEATGGQPLDGVARSSLGKFPAHPTSEDVSRPPVDLLDRLGILQIDSVNVLARPQDLVPYARHGPYDVAGVRDAVYQGRRGFEYWGHEASRLPMSDYRYFRFRMDRYRESGTHFHTVGPEFREAHTGLIQHILDRIGAEGGLVAGAFEAPENAGPRGTWWATTPVKRALEHLFATGELMVSGRTTTFARVYDLPERVLSPGIDTSDPCAAAAARYLLYRAIAAQGVATSDDAADYYRLRPHDWRPALQALVESGEVVPVQVDGWRGLAYALPAVLDALPALPDHRPVFLSPFDNLIWYRDRTERLFGFHYRIEIYVPESQRRYGYYVLPLLVGGTLGGRADLKLDRQTSTLLVRGLWLEGAAPAEAAAALRDLAVHLGASTIAVERVDPADAWDTVQSAL